MRQSRQGDERSVSDDSVDHVTSVQDAHSTARTTEQALADFGAPRGVAKPYASARPFLRCLSGIDELRVMRAAKDADDERDPYGWWRR